MHTDTVKASNFRPFRLFRISTDSLFLIGFAVGSSGIDRNRHRLPNKRNVGDLKNFILTSHKWWRYNMSLKIVYNDSYSNVIKSKIFRQSQFVITRWNFRDRIFTLFPICSRTWASCQKSPFFGPTLNLRTGNYLVIQQKWDHLFSALTIARIIDIKHRFLKSYISCTC
jgi:hypothetical protein